MHKSRTCQDSGCLLSQRITSVCCLGVVFFGFGFSFSVISVNFHSYAFLPATDTITDKYNHFSQARMCVCGCVGAWGGVGGCGWVCTDNMVVALSVITHTTVGAKLVCTCTITLHPTRAKNDGLTVARRSAGLGGCNSVGVCVCVSYFGEQQPASEQRTISAAHTRTTRFEQTRG